MEIKVNLLPSDRRANFTEFGGIKLNLINLKLLIPFFLAVYLIEPVVESIYSGDIERFKKASTSNKSKLRKLKNESRKYDSIKKQVKQLNEQEKQLAEKIKVVKEIVDKRQNPFKVLRYIAENIPKDVWLVELELDDKRLKLVGYSKSWKSIGQFIENLKTSIFFNGNVNYTRPSNLNADDGQQKFEPYEITTNVVSFK